MAKTIYELPQIITQLAKDERLLFDRIFSYDASQVKFQVPASMRTYCERFFGSVEAVQEQRPIKITNKVTLETSIFNKLRARRPQSYNDAILEDQIEAERKNDPFADPEQGTAADVFGRIEGEYCLTASNVAKFDAWHSVTIFNEYHPLKFTAPQVVDYLMTARAWAEEAHNQDDKACYFFFMWNCMLRAGASLLHGHAQMTLTHQQHYGKIERLRRDAIEYKRQHKRNFFNDFVQIHRALGLTVTPADHVVALVPLTPVAEREIWLISDLWSPELAVALYEALDFYKKTGAVAFNVAAYVPPIAATPSGEDWSEFPTIIRLVDRGEPMARSSDFGAMNIFAANPMINDPFEVAAGFQKSLS